MKKLLIVVIAATTLLVGCGKEKVVYNDENLVMATDSELLRSYYECEDRDTFDGLVLHKIDYINTALKEADDLNEYTVKYVEKYLIACYELKNATTEEKNNRNIG